MKPPLASVTVEDFHRHHGGKLGLHLLAGAEGLSRLIREPTVNRPGLALAGFRRYFAPKRIQVMGNVETSYLRSLDAATREQRYQELFQSRIPCVVICRGIRPEKRFLAMAEKANVPVLQTSLLTMTFINRATIALDSLFAPRGQVHGSMVDIHGIGVIVQGESGIGKSEAVLGLLERGYALVADDITTLRLLDGREVIGAGKAITRNLMEVRGIGIIDVAAMFGAGAIQEEKRVDLVVTLKSWEQVTEVDRLGLEEHHITLLGLPVPHMEIPVRPGRDLSQLIEVAAFQTKLRARGINAAQDLSDRLTAAMNPGL